LEWISKKLLTSSGSLETERWDNRELSREE
jgi:hypothetical protein